jgi:hypothetical protein
MIEKGGRIIGTAIYMAPERLLGKDKGSARGDIYSLGMTCVELLNGEVPSAGQRTFEVLAQTTFGCVRELEFKRTDLGSELEMLLRKMTAPEPGNRPGSAEEVRKHVEALLAEAEQRRPYVQPLGRADEAAVAAAQAKLKTNTLVKVLLESLTGPALMLNASRQVVMANGKAVALFGAKDAGALAGRRVGELLECRDARRGAEGCGTGEGCPYCRLGAALSEVQQGQKTPLEGECLVCCENGTSLEFTYRLNQIDLGDGGFLLVALRDLSSEKRREVLERSLVANLLDTADLVRSLAASTSDELAQESVVRASFARKKVSGLLSEASKALMEEAVFQQHLLAGEAGELWPLWTCFAIDELLTEVCEQLRHHAVGEGRELALSCSAGLRVLTDRILLQRSVKNLVRNALEACAPGEKVTVCSAPMKAPGRAPDGAAMDDEWIEIRVHNPQVMPPEVRLQVFKRSFSTKAATGRGIGTHAARLFVEGFLHGQVGFSSEAPGGTIFWIRVPKEPPAAALGSRRGS